MSTLTKKQECVFNYIAKNIECHGYSPSIRDIASALKLKSTSTVSGHLDALEAKGWITRQYGIPRSISIVRKTATQNIVT